MSYLNEGDEQERKLFVGGFNKASTDEDHLKVYFEHYGGIVDCTILRDADKRSRGFGFILFDDAETVDKIMRAKKGGTRFSIDDGDTYMEVKRALPKGSRDPSSRGERGPIQSSRSTNLYNKVFVGGLPSSITEEELRHYFETYGRVNQIELLRDRETNRLRGFAFVSFEDEDSADKCIQRRSHEICRKICEVKRAHNREKDQGNITNSSRRSDGGGYDNRDRDIPKHGQIQPPTNTDLGSDVNALIQQAFLMGQQSVYQQAGLQPPTVNQLNLGASGMGMTGGANTTLIQPTNNLLLQALAGQQVTPTVAPVVSMVAPAPVAPVAPAAPVTNSTDTLAQLAQLLQGGGVPSSALGALLKSDPVGQSQGQRVQPVRVGASSNGYSTSYPGVYSQSSINYGPTKYEDPNAKRGYRPY